MAMRPRAALPKVAIMSDPHDRPAPGLRPLADPWGNYQPQTPPAPPAPPPAPPPPPTAKAPAPPPADPPAEAVAADPPSRSRPAKRRKAVPTVALYVRIPATLQRNLKLMAVAEDTTISQLVADILKANIGVWVEPYRRAS